MSPYWTVWDPLNNISDLSLSTVYEKTGHDWELASEALMYFLTMDCFHMPEISHNFEMVTKISLFQK